MKNIVQKPLIRKIQEEIIIKNLQEKINGYRKNN